MIFKMILEGGVAVEFYGYLSQLTDRPVACFGREGAYTMEAMAYIFGKMQATTAYDRFEGLFEALLAGKHDLGVVPLENSTTGSVLAVIDALATQPLHIIGELEMPIRHQLAGLAGAGFEDLQVVYSHPQALFQCRHFLSCHPHIDVLEVSSTAVAAEKVAQLASPACAAVCSNRAAEHYGLSIIVKDVHDVDNNTTRFGVIASQPHLVPVQHKGSITFTTAHRSGALVAVLQVLAYYQINMIRIESRPIAGERWNYRFFVDVDMPRETGVLEQALEAARPFMQGVRILGIYPTHRMQV